MGKYTHDSFLGLDFSTTSDGGLFIMAKSWSEQMRWHNRSLVAMRLLAFTLQLILFFLMFQSIRSACAQKLVRCADKKGNCIQYDLTKHTTVLRRLEQGKSAWEKNKALKEQMAAFKRLHIINAQRLQLHAQQIASYQRIEKLSQRQIEIMAKQNVDLRRQNADLQKAMNSPLRNPFVWLAIGLAAGAATTAIIVVAVNK